MTNFLNQIPTKVIIDGSGNKAVQRQQMMINGSVVIDDPINERTIVSITAAGTQNLSSVLVNGNSAGTTIKNLSSPVENYDAANKLYVDTSVSTMSLSKVLTNGIQTVGKNIDFTQGSYLFSTDGYVSINDILSMNNYQIKNVADPTLSTDVATKNYVDSKNNLQKLSDILTNGNSSLGQNIIMATGYIKELHDPTDAQDAVTKTYADTKVAKVASTDNAITRFDGTTGIIQNSTVTLSDTGAFSNVLYTDYVGSTSAYAEGRVYYDSDAKTLCYHTQASGVNVNIGQELMIYVRNNSGSTIPNGSVVYVNGALGQRPTVALASALDGTPDITSIVIGITTHDIANNTNGYVTTYGIVRGLNTSSYADGDRIYLSTTAGAYTNVKPSAPNRIIPLGIVSYSHVNQGEVFIRLRPIYKVDDLSDGYAENLSKVLSRGNSAGTYGVNMNNNSITNVNTLSGYTGTNLAITSASTTSITSATSLTANITSGQYIYQFGGTTTIIESSTYKSETERDVAVTSYNQIPSAGILRLVSAGTDRTVGRLNSTGTVCVDTIENWR